MLPGAFLFSFPLPRKTKYLITAMKHNDIDICNNCHKKRSLCVCSVISPQHSAISIIILQHPQEPDKDLGTARIAELSLKNAKLVVGLSWRSLKAVAGENAQAADWGVFFLGSAKLRNDISKKDSPLLALSKKGLPLEDSAARIKKIKGLIFLDGTWAQAKALWWRNPWLLKLNRLILNPNKPSLYGPIRREPRKECLSTIEAIGQALTELDNDINYDKLVGPFKALLEKYRTK